MEQFHFALSWMLYITIPLWLLMCIMRYIYAKKIIYRTSLVTILQKYRSKRHPSRIILNVMRGIVLLILALLIAQPQWYDQASSITVNGIDIVLVLDTSGSMGLTDLSVDERSRFEIAKKEALRFIEMRTYDAIGLVLFAAEAISRVPVTMDKELLKSVIRDTRIGDLDEQGTLLGHAMLLGINRLKDSTAKSKVMVLLTDGTPTGDDIEIETPVNLAKKYNIKIYTIGIGGDKDIQVFNQFGISAIVPRVNRKLLEAIAQETSGQSFLAKSEKDMHDIYTTIDKLEAAEHEVPLYTQYHPLLAYGLLVIALLLSVELIFSTFLWFALC